ncbi:hypothetical protein FUSO4_02090 [Fusobacterium necrophorum DJ-1]|uniref:PIN family toxin-antitoxin system n=1 Tax=Fusobacterium necrophorum DJ-2 TaxID=1441737 RepID=A0AB73C617_9FUSO|nr:hypothetical protein FUSO4_02090 [Fusobacterium necrophorum DJ-1]KDE73679.1 hypothetical protein FUSO8_00675 [Fusobacterium necrophorum DJ-2]
MELYMVLKRKGEQSFQLLFFFINLRVCFNDYGLYFYFLILKF